MKIAIQNHTQGFHKAWIAYCEQHDIAYKLVDAYANDAIEQIRDCDIFLWHFHQGNYKDMQMAQPLLYSLEAMGKKVFPDFHTCWHFDNKVAQKYLLEAIGAPLVPTYVYYTKEEALKGISEMTFPKVFKLKGGAGASNVRLAKTEKEARRLINQAFGKGFSQYSVKSHFKDALRRYRQGKNTLCDVLRPFFYALKPYPTEFAHYHGREIGYVYFQDYIPMNTTDFRVKVVGGNCWAFQRKVRKNDFRASGSGELLFNKDSISMEIVKIAQDVAKKLSLQSVAFDFVQDKINNKYLLVEMSYGFGFDEEETTHGYWDADRVFHTEKFNPFQWMIEEVMEAR